jgi:hypothetical protein
MNLILCVNMFMKELSIYFGGFYGEVFGSECVIYLLNFVNSLIMFWFLKCSPPCLLFSVPSVLLCKK